MYVLASFISRAILMKAGGFSPTINWYLTNSSPLQRHKFCDRVDLSGVKFGWFGILTHVYLGSSTPVSQPVSYHKQVKVHHLIMCCCDSLVVKKGRHRILLPQLANLFPFRQMALKSVHEVLTEAAANADQRCFFYFIGSPGETGRSWCSFCRRGKEVLLSPYNVFFG